MKALLVQLIFILSLSSLAQKIPKIVFVSPDPKDSVNEFWTTTHKNLQQAALDLKIDLEIIYTNSHHSFYMDAIAKLSKRKKENIPNYFIGLPHVHYEKRILDLLESRNIKSLFVNMAIEGKIRDVIGYPRGRYKNWIGHFYPDDYNAGAQITKEISKVCKKESNIVVISGDHLSTAAKLREQAFIEESKKYGLNINQIFEASWKKANVIRMVPYIETRYKNICGFLVASDSMAEGVLESSKKKYHVCGIDWTKKGLELVQEGKLVCTAGGHFLEPAFALVALFDYHNGIDFKDDLGLTYKTPFHIATKKNVSKILKSFFTGKQVLNYKDYSKFYNPIKKYHFDIK